jgi:hypothetical protein
MYVFNQESAISQFFFLCLLHGLKPSSLCQGLNSSLQGPSFDLPKHGFFWDSKQPRSFGLKTSRHYRFEIPKYIQMHRDCAIQPKIGQSIVFPKWIFHLFFFELIANNGNDKTWNAGIFYPSKLSSTSSKKVGLGMRKPSITVCHHY